MKLFSMFSKKTSLHPYHDFWSWFLEKQAGFHKCLSNNIDVTKNVVQVLVPELQKLNGGFYMACGMLDSDIAKLIITADGNTKNMVFVEELISMAPAIAGWEIMAHKPPRDIKQIGLRIGGFSITAEGLSFYAIQRTGYPDEVNLGVVYDKFVEEGRDAITNGIRIFLDNLLGELNFVSNIDRLSVVGPDDVAGEELIPITKLNEYLHWREREFIEKYEGTWHDSENDNHSILTATTRDGLPMTVLVNTDLMRWDAKASHPWLLVIDLEYKARKDGMPTPASTEILNKIDEDVYTILSDREGCLNVVRETGQGQRSFYFACKDFRKASLSAAILLKKYQPLILGNYELFKDKYWQTLKGFEH